MDNRLMCSRLGRRKKDVEWIARWMKANDGIDVTLKKSAVGGGIWRVRGSLPIAKLAEFCGLEARKEQGK